VPAVGQSTKRDGERVLHDERELCGRNAAVARDRPQLEDVRTVRLARRPKRVVFEQFPLLDFSID
jgi:hypothetical protein